MSAARRTAPAIGECDTTANSTLVLAFFINECVVLVVCSEQNLKFISIACLTVHLCYSSASDIDRA
jgi:hypothetical protein